MTDPSYTPDWAIDADMVDDADDYDNTNDDATTQQTNNAIRTPNH